MFATLLQATLIFFFAATALAQTNDFAVNTPELFQCQDVKISWQEATRPYDVAIMAASDQCGEPIVELGEQNATVLSWKVNQAAGSKLIISILDHNDNEAWSGEMTVQPSNDTSCLKTTSSSTSTKSGARTTLVATNTVFAPAGSTSGASGPAVAAGAANAGELPASNGATSSARLPAAATVFGVLAGIVVSFAL